MICVYSTSIERPCGRPATQPGPHCDFHAVLAQLDGYDFHNPTPIVVPESVRPMVDRILANFDTMPHPPEDGDWFRWTQSPVIYLNGSHR